MRPRNVAAALLRPAVSGTMRARQAKKQRENVTKRQWFGYIAVAAATTWLTKNLDDIVEQRLDRSPVR
jgi:hypothetical protein